MAYKLHGFIIILPCINPAPERNKMQTVYTQRIAQLRARLHEAKLDAWIVPTADPHLSEYLPAHWQQRVWLTGFDGSAGTAVVTAGHAGVWADSRYWEQAAQQLNGTGIALHKLAGEGSNHAAWLAANLPEGSTVGVAADILSLHEQDVLQAAFAAHRLTLQVGDDILAGLWADRPPLPQAPIYEHDSRYAGETATAKLAQVRAAMREQGADFHLLSSLDDIAWLTNLRGSDVSFNPVFLAHLLISADTATLFVNPAKLDAALTARMAAQGFQVAAYETAARAVGAIAANQSLLFDPAKTAVGTQAQLNEGVRRIRAVSPSTYFKSVKSAADLAHVRDAMRADGAALCRFFADFERRLAAGERLTELDVDRLLTAERAKHPLFVSLSFDTIAGFNANGALPHYRATAAAHAVIEGDGLLLIDSGGQYTNGTTDITRVVPIGRTSAEQRRDYTLVLKSHIALSTACFPEGIASPLLDAIARAPLWAAQRDYGHGTGHGVGYFLNVHEGPQRIALQAAPVASTAMRAGMITSNEPGLYRPNRWGIRIENLVANVPVPEPQENEFGCYLCFETLTLCPIDTRLIDTALLTPLESGWLNEYHRLVREQLSPLLEGEALAWLLARTQPL